MDNASEEKIKARIVKQCSTEWKTEREILEGAKEKDASRVELHRLLTEIVRADLLEDWSEEVGIRERRKNWLRLNPNPPITWPKLPPL